MPETAGLTLDERVRRLLLPLLGVGMSLFVLVQVNYATVSPMSQLAVFALLGLVLCYLIFPLHPRLAHVRTLRWVDMLLALAAAGCCVYLIWHGDDLGRRAGMYTRLDVVVGIAGIVLVLEATRRAIGIFLPLLAIAFLLYAIYGPAMPDWDWARWLPHRGYSPERVVGQTFLRTEGVFGTALRIMFMYVFLFVLFGAFLTATGATQFIIDFAQRLFGNKPGGPAKVSVLASGMMGSLSGSAVANAATTGTFTIPMMKSIGFRPHIAGGVEAATSSGGALVPPVMGAGAYMMLEIIGGDITYLQIIQAALLPAILYYLSIFLLVHFYANRIGARPPRSADAPAVSGLWSIEALTFFLALGSLILFLILGYSPARAVTYALGVVVVLSILKPREAVSGLQQGLALAACLILPFATKWGGGLFGRGLDWPEAIVFALAAMFIAGLIHPVWRPLVRDAFVTAARGGIPLIVATACVGIIIGVVMLTGVGTRFPSAIIPLAEQSLFLALVAIMACSIILGMGLPSAVSYLLLATLVGPVLTRLDVPVLAAHMFIFYFGLMAMVTPPVALAGYATASIAGAPVMRTGLAAFRFALVGFTLPFMFVYRPELLMIGPDGGRPDVLSVAIAVTAAALGVLSLAAGMAGYLFARLSWSWRTVLFIAAACALFPDQRFVVMGLPLAIFDLLGVTLLVLTAAVNYRARQRSGKPLAVAPVVQPSPATTEK